MSDEIKRYEWKSSVGTMALVRGSGQNEIELELNGMPLAIVPGVPYMMKLEILRLANALRAKERELAEARERESKAMSERRCADFGDLVWP